MNGSVLRRAAGISFGFGNQLLFLITVMVSVLVSVRRHHASFIEQALGGHRLCVGCAVCFCAFMDIVAGHS